MSLIDRNLLALGDQPGNDTSERIRDYLMVGQLAAVLAGGIHAAVVPEHLSEAPLIGGFFLVVALSQLGLAAALRRRPPVLVVLGAIWAQVALIATYVATRTVDLPFLPPDHGASSVEHLPVAGGVGNGIPAYPGSRIEPVGVLDVVCLGAEVVLLAALLGLLPTRLRSRTASALVVLGVGAVLARTIGLLA